MGFSLGSQLTKDRHYTQNSDRIPQLVSRRPIGSPFHPSRGPLAAILLLFPRRLQFPIPVGVNLLLMPGEYDRSKMNCFQDSSSASLICCDCNAEPSAIHKGFVDDSAAVASERRLLGRHGDVSGNRLPGIECGF